LTFLGERVSSSFEHDGLFKSGTVTLEVLEDGVSLGNSFTFGRVLDGGDLDRQLLLGSDDVGSSRDLDGRVRRLVGVDVARIDLEVKVGSDGERVRFVVPFEPFLRLEDGERFGRLDRNRVGRRVDTGEGLSVVGELSTVEEGRRNFENGDTFRRGLLALRGRGEEEDGTLDGDGLSSVRVGDGFDAGSRGNDVSRLKDGSSRKDAETVRKVNELEEISIDRIGEDGLHDGL
jgi:hypothetical protein